MPVAQVMPRSLGRYSVPLLTLLTALLTLVIGFSVFRYPASSRGFRVLAFEQGWGQLGIDNSAAGSALSMRGKRYLRGIGTHAASLIEIEVREGASKLVAEIGVDDAGQGGGSVIFKVLDGSKVLFQSQVLRGTDPPLAIAVPLSGERRLRLVVEDTGDGVISDVADWADLSIE